MKVLKTKKLEEFIIDEKHYDFVKGYNWYLTTKKYVVNSKCILSRKESRETGKPRKKVIFIHRLVYELEHNIKLTSSMHIDHIDRDPLNNQISNLRISTKGDSINAINCGLRKDNTTGYKGVRFKKRTQRYEVYINIKGKRHYGGSSKDIHEAGKLYNEIALKLHGEFAYLNEIKK